MIKKIFVSIVVACLLFLATSFQNNEFQNVKADELSNPITGEEVEGNFDSQKAPYLLITEIVPKSSKVDSVDGYEFVEIYNNSTKSINLKDYKIVYNN